MTSSAPYAEVIGDPIAHSKSPLIHRFWLEKLGTEGDYRACHVKPGELADYFARRRGDGGWRGSNLTIPHKVAAMTMVDEVDPSAKEVGAANCVVRRGGRLVASNTDVFGIAASLPDPGGAVCMIGAGGAARAAIRVFGAMGLADIRILARDPERAERSLEAFPGLALRFFPIERAEQAMESVGGVINASPLGMAGQPPMSPPVLDALVAVRPGGYVFDMVYAPLRTELIDRAAAMGLATIDGLTMLIGQARQSFSAFFGAIPPGEHDAELRERLTA